MEKNKKKKKKNFLSIHLFSFNFFELQKKKFFIQIDWRNNIKMESWLEYILEPKLLDELVIF